MINAQVNHRLLVLLLSLLTVHPLLCAERVRPSALAGSWYPADPVRLAAEVDHYLEPAAVPRLQTAQAIRAMILPHAGYRYSGAVAGRGIGLLRGKRYRRVVILAPSHHSPFHGLSIADVEFYATPLGKIGLDAVAIQQLRRSPLVRADAQAHVREHSIEILLPLLQRSLAAGWRLVPVLVGRLDPADYPRVAAVLRSLVDAESLLLVSSDFTHYGARFGYQPFPVDRWTKQRIDALDAGALQYIRQRDVAGLLAYQEATGITICGYRAIALLLELLPDGLDIEPIAYATSADITDDVRHSVSYLAVIASGSVVQTHPRADSTVEPTD
jgi:AmmeMemoRadiSam system protein B